MRDGYIIQESVQNYLIQKFNFLKWIITMFTLPYSKRTLIFFLKVWWVYRMLCLLLLFCPFSAFFNHSKWINHLSRDLQSRQSLSSRRHPENFDVPHTQVHSQIRHQMTLSKANIFHRSLFFYPSGYNDNK